MEKGKKFESVAEYLSAFSEIRPKLEELRDLILKAAPGAEELISYNMPAYKWNGMLVYFGAAKAHVGFYPTPSAIKAFSKELEGYQTSKGAIQFPLSKPIPKALVRQIVRFRMLENEEKAKAKAKGVKKK